MDTLDGMSVEEIRKYLISRGEKERSSFIDDQKEYLERVRQLREEHTAKEKLLRKEYEEKISQKSAVLWKVTATPNDTCHVEYVVGYFTSNPPTDSCKSDGVTWGITVEKIVLSGEELKSVGKLDDHSNYPGYDD